MLHRAFHGLPVGAMARAAGPWHPSNLFANGEYGYAFDPSDTGKVWQQINGSTAGATGQPVGRLDDISGNGRHFAAAANDTTRPTLQADGTLLFDGSNDGLLLESAGMWAAGAATVIVAISGDRQNDRRWWAEGNSGDGNPFYVPYTQTPGSSGYEPRAFIRDNFGATLVTGDGGVTLLDGDPHVLRAIDTGSGLTVHVDGEPGTTRNYTRGTLTLNRTALGLLYRNGKGNYFAGSIGRGIWIGRVLDAGEIAAAEAWVAGD